MNLRVVVALAFAMATFFTSCQEEDDVPPVITLSGEASVTHSLNQVYDDAGATALDETDGDITSEIYIENQVNVDLLGEYFVYYKVVDDAGNEASEVSRSVTVVNDSRAYAGDFNVDIEEVFTGNDACNYQMYFAVDSTINNRMVFNAFGCDYTWPVYVNVSDSTLIIPYQAVEDTVLRYHVQGSGFITDTTMYIEYKKVTDTITTYWKADYVRISE